MKNELKKIGIGFFMAWGNFFWIPCPVKKWDEGAKKYMLVLLEIIGLIIGLIQFAIFMAIRHPVTSVNGNMLLAALLTVIPFALTGFIHIDGFMDVSDGIMSRRDQEERIRILKDSRVGAFAVVMVISMFLLYFASIYSIIGSDNSTEKMFALSLLPLIVRGLAASDVLRNKPIAVSQFAPTYDPNEKNEKYRVFIAIIALVVIVIYFMMTYAYFNNSPTLVFGILFAVIGQFFSSLVARRSFGGMNGDIAGYSIVWGELVGVMGLGLIQ